MTAEMLTAIACLKLKGARQFRTTRDGVVITQPNKPDLLLTYEAAEQFAHQIQEAEAS